MKLRRTRHPHGLISLIKLSGNTIQTATADLLLSADGVNYGASQPGFVFGQLVPGGATVATAGNPVFLKNTGDAPLSPRLSVSSLPANLDGVDLTKAHVILSPTAGGSVQNFTLQGLITAAVTGGQPILSPAQLLPGANEGYELQVSLESDAVNGPGATILSFIGLAGTQ